jgi:L-ascorbate metabolism protein UlaG (beta-lactamase superfamily)
MKITKYVHSCLLVETNGRVAIFDPGSMSYPEFDIEGLEQLDDIFVTHMHQDHFHLPFIKELLAKFPDARITAPKDVVEELTTESIKATSDASEGVSFFNSPHEDTAPLFPELDEIGIHYLESLSHPGDSHSFHETKEILALPITAPWGSTIKAVNIALELKPKYVIPIHDWHWKEEVRLQMYNVFEEILSKKNITMFKPETGKTIDIPLDV